MPLWFRKGRFLAPPVERAVRGPREGVCYQRSVGQVDEPLGPLVPVTRSSGKPGHDHPKIVVYLYQRFQE